MIIFIIWNDCLINVSAYTSLITVHNDILRHLLRISLIISFDL